MAAQKQETPLRGWKMVATAAGGFLAAILAWWIIVALAAENSVLREAVTKNPPWILISGIAVGPTLILLWYWRDKHKHRDLLIREKDSVQKRFEEAKAQFDLAREPSEEVRARAVPKLIAVAIEDPRLRMDVMDMFANVGGEHVKGGQKTRSMLRDGIAANAAHHFLKEWVERVNA